MYCVVFGHGIMVVDHGIVVFWPRHCCCWPRLHCLGFLVLGIHQFVFYTAHASHDHAHTTLQASQGLWLSNNEGHWNSSKCLILALNWNWLLYNRGPSVLCKNMHNYNSLLTKCYLLHPIHLISCGPFVHEQLQNIMGFEIFNVSWSQLFEVDLRWPLWDGLDNKLVQHGTLSMSSSFHAMQTFMWIIVFLQISLVI